MKNYPIVAKQLFQPEIHSEIKAYVKEFTPLLPMAVDDQDFIRKYAHNPPFFVKIHHQLAAFASKQFKKKVKPSYCFLSMYQENGICPLHIDRPQCRYTIDYLIQSTHPEPWPIHIGRHLTDKHVAELNEKGESHPSDEDSRQKIIDNEKWSTVLLEENDAVLYSGTNSWHYRSDRLRGNADLVFFHFVPEDFDGPLD
jgi:hypothetical protein